MLKRLAVSFLPGIALLFSQGAVLLVLGLCPHIRSGLPNCNTAKTELVMDHEAMGHHEMNLNAPVEIHNADKSLPAFGEPEQPCSHCAIHSRSNSNESVLRTADTVKRSSDVNVPHTVSVISTVAFSFVAIPTSRAHGPPGQTTPKYILISTFRI